jgi:hypothetical protein
MTYKVSNCCCAPSLGELDTDNTGRCSECFEGAVFYDEQL